MSAAKKAPAFGLQADEHGVCTLAFLTESVACECGRMAGALVNRDGATRCLVCDELYLKNKEQKP